ncbi:hypothetical protein CH373_00405 [Leptospira perolatii]|uniref:Peptidase MA-like domain-containing protein n=1 Tax=Leptospira perolatii TaxID=2023191 RepID=A0A2M9ZR77_9LEPT|nr:hypothetical protein [Leptospira perolatii]PJZ71030.1 hypothetical protein CH360_00405 [Leptospira perolatii]PJZ74562.1 hypothetical protein CH373_00405 [Leptospira perolatii]
MRSYFSASKKVFRQLLGLVVICTILLSSPVNSEKVKKPGAANYYSFRLKEGEVKVFIRNETDNSEWNQYALEKSKDLIRAYESFTGVPFHQATGPVYKSLPVGERNSIRLILKDTVFLNGTRVGGYNNASGGLPGEVGIFMEFGLVPPGYPALLLHELGHYYFSEPNWLAEGIVSFLPFLLSKKGFLKLDSEELGSVVEEWGLEEKAPSSDLPLPQSFGSSDPKLGLWPYAKAVRFQAVLCKELGSYGYRMLLKELSLKDVQDTNSLIRILHSIKPIDWTQVLKGWVIAGSYGPYNTNSFSKLKDWEGL